MGVMRKDELQKLQNVRKVELGARSILSHPDSMAKGKRKKRKKKRERERKDMSSTEPAVSSGLSYNHYVMRESLLQVDVALS